MPRPNKLPHRSRIDSPARANRARLAEGKGETAHAAGGLGPHQGARDAFKTRRASVERCSSEAPS
jgi:hypothetical protein